jgi:putative cell wall-binding protein
VEVGATVFKVRAVVMRFRRFGLVPVLVVVALGMFALPAVAEESAVADVTIIGGPAVISDQIAEHLESCSETGVARISGSDRYATATEVAFEFSSPDIVLIATGENFPDAISAGAIGALLGAPILLTHHNSMPTVTSDALEALAPNTVVILGGEAAVSAGVESKLAAAYPSVTRLWGNDRYGTAAAVALWHFADPSAVDTVYVVSGDHYVDALVAGPLATTDGAPVLLVRQDTIPGSTMREIERLSPSRIVIVGGSLVVGSEVESLLSGTGAAVSRIDGSSRYATAASAASGAAPGSRVYLATGVDFPDGLTATPLANGAPILLVDDNALPAATASAIAARTGQSCEAWSPPYSQVGAGKRVIYTLSGHQWWMIDENEDLVDTYLVTGRRGIPHPGTYSVFSKSVNAWAPFDGITMKHMVRFVRPYTWGNPWSYGFHSIPRWPNGTPLQTEAELGSYGSGGCVRQADDKAKAMFDWAEIGTTVIVLP